jgi:hypothetical protein
VNKNQYLKKPVLDGGRLRIMSKKLTGKSKQSYKLID